MSRIIKYFNYSINSKKMEENLKKKRKNRRKNEKGTITIYFNT